MASDPRRYTRQVRLAEIGERGQAALAGARPALGARGFAREVERNYLALAGTVPEDDGVPASVDVATLGLRHEASREVGEGALRALAAMRAILGVS
jgi:hypothetical protein